MRVDSSPVSTLISPSVIHPPFLLQLSFGAWKMKETIALASEQHGAHHLSTVVQTGQQHVWEMDRNERYCPFERHIYKYFLPFEVLALSSQSVQNVSSQMFAERVPLICKGRRMRSLYVATCWPCTSQSGQKKGRFFVIPLPTASQLAALIYRETPN